jgi:hypothetical protein
MHIKIVTRLALVMAVLLVIGVFSSPAAHAASGTLTFNWYDEGGSLAGTQVIESPADTGCTNLNVPSGYPLGSETVNATDRGIVVFARADCDQTGPTTNVFPGETQGKTNFFPKSYRVGVCCS